MNPEQALEVALKAVAAKGVEPRCAVKPKHLVASALSKSVSGKRCARAVLGEYIAKRALGERTDADFDHMVRLAR